MDDFIKCAKFSERAKWIWAHDNAQKNDWVAFTASVTVPVDAPRDSAVMKISAETRYFLYVNGTAAVLDGGLFGDAYSKNSGFVDEVDISPFLCEGLNDILLKVWYYGNGGRNNSFHAYAGVIFECEALGLYSDNTVRCARLGAFAKQGGGDQPSYIFGGHNIYYDANKEQYAWGSALEYDAALYGARYIRPIPLFRFSDTVYCESTPGAGIKEVKLPYAMHVFPSFEVEAAGGEVIKLCHDRYVVNGGPGDHYSTFNGHRTEYICKPGLNIFLNPDSFPCEKLYFDIPAGVEIKKLGYVISEYDCDVLPLPETGDPLMDRLFQKCAVTLRFCMRDNFMDCPDREKGQWVGDVCVQAPQVFYVLDERAYPLLKKAIYNFFLLSQGGVLKGNMPGEHGEELPAQSLNAISTIGMVASYYGFTKDKEVLKAALEPSYRYLSLWSMDGDGRLVPRKGDCSWFDHLYNRDIEVMEACWYYMALDFLEFCQSELGDFRYRSFTDGRKKLIADSFNHRFWKGKFYASGTFVDERANALAVLSNLAPKEHYSFIRDVLVSVNNCTPYMEGYVLEALCAMGCEAEAKRRMLSRYYNLIVNDNSTLWEDFNLLGTKNHAWTGSPLTVWYKYFSKSQ